MTQRRITGNAKIYSVKNTVVYPNSPLCGDTYFFLGSSITYGSASFGESMADFLAKKHQCHVIKEAVSGTTLLDSNDASYVKRIANFDKGAKIDGFITQLSTNDIYYNRPGEISSSFTISDFDTTTTIGAIEYIIAYAKTYWKCPIFFYTNSFFNNSLYSQLVNTLGQIAQKWGIRIIDLYTDSKFNQIETDQRRLYLADDVHPKRAGYKEWWLVKFEDALISAKKL